MTLWRTYWTRHATESRARGHQPLTTTQPLSIHVSLGNGHLADFIQASASCVQVPRRRRIQIGPDARPIIHRIGHQNALQFAQAPVDSRMRDGLQSEAMSAALIQVTATDCAVLHPHTENHTHTLKNDAALCANSFVFSTVRSALSSIALSSLCAA